ncbi:thioesterase [Streptomyces sp. CB01881]|uniref:thioesterase II family protein n=1 Tax=Streptomyces sp. CB01881 TaxID=2078691 RepID=UPI001386BFE4|nr:thioesterase [Streptomyces sp. CB01881]
MSAIRRLTTPGRPRARLVCFPHAGGSANFFRPWADLVPMDTELWAVQYPGRHDRIAAPCLDEMTAMVGDVLPGLEAAERLPTVLFGHSMGAAIAYECSRRLSETPRLLVLSGRGGPGRSMGEELADKSDADLVSALGELGELDPALLEHPDLLDLVMPLLRADCRLSESYLPDPDRPTDAPVLACVGDRDPLVSEDDILAWEKSTTGSFTHCVYPGDHFYLREHAPALIRAALEGCETARSHTLRK